LREGAGAGAVVGVLVKAVVDAVVVEVVVGAEEDPGTGVGGDTDADAALNGILVKIQVHANTEFADRRLLALLLAVLMQLKEQHFCCLFCARMTPMTARLRLRTMTGDENEETSVK
jgi:hypothetical protein